jgi:hypothetical protein
MSENQCFKHLRGQWAPLWIDYSTTSGKFRFGNNFETGTTKTLFVTLDKVRYLFLCRIHQFRILNTYVSFAHNSKQKSRQLGICYLPFYDLQMFFKIGRPQPSRIFTILFKINYKWCMRRLTITCSWVRLAYHSNSLVNPSSPFFVKLFLSSSYHKHWKSRSPNI